ncbi:MAG: GGDEF domain-containing protein [Rhizobium sp.]|nr:GGDEF domain-containing protein [Rhizobium sp.]MBW8321331.1 GGDEF domain-containing protein [Rhizobium sp.]MBW8444942.1 GGDEF domain-containing protein [Arenimonas sp.]
MIDIKTALLLWAMEAATLAVLLAAVWFHDRGQRHFALWSLGFFAQGSGVALIALRGLIPDFASIEVANTVALSSFFFWTAGLLHLAKRPASVLALIPLLLWIGGMLVPVVRETIAYRIALYNFGTACGHIVLAAVVVRHEVARPRYRRLFVGICSIQAVAGLLVMMMSLLTLPSSIQAAPHAAITAAINLFGFLTAILIGAKIVMDRSEERLQQLIRTDPLTGALNRRGVSEGFASLTAPSNHATPSLALLLFDLDHFKRINDTHGHQAGDAVLVAFAGICRELTPKCGLFGRTGGEEFMALLPINDMKDAALLAETIRQSLATAKIDTGGELVSVTVSIGIATSAKSAANLDQMMSNADRALYKAKARGRNRTTILNGDRVLTVPSAGPEALDEQADRQVAALKRLMARVEPKTGLTKP